MPIVFNRDLALIQHPVRLLSSKDLAEITELAQDRKCWEGIKISSRKPPKCHRLRTGTGNSNKLVNKLVHQ